MDIGSLTGQISIEDQLTDKLELMAHHVKQFADNFDGLFGAAAIAAGVFSAAVVGAVISITQLGEKGSELIGVEDAFNRLAAAGGEAGEVLITSLSAGVRDTVDSMELMTSVSRAMTAGVKLNAEDMTLLGQAARAMGKATGTDAAAGLSTLSSALATGVTRQLKMAGVTIDLTNVEEKYALSQGLVISQLTDRDKLEARRGGILQAVRGYVDRLGDSEVNLAERMQQGQVWLGNWVDSLAKAVATSPSVMHAFDAIQESLTKAFGGSSKTLLEWTINWIDRFSEGVAKYAPIIINAFVSVRDWVVNIWDAVTRAWDLVPDWLKNIARDAAIAGVGLYAVAKSIATAEAAVAGLAGQNTTTTRSVVSEWGTITSAVIDAGKVFTQVLPDALKKTQEGFALGRAAVNTFGESLITAAGSHATLLAQLGTGAVVVGSTIAVVTAAYQGWKLWSENADRAAAASRQLVTDQANLSRLNTSMGTSYKTLDEAMKEWYLRLKEAKPAVEVLTAEQQRAAAAIEMHKNQVIKLASSLASVSEQVDVTSEALDKLTGLQKLNQNVQAAVIPLLDKRIAQNLELTTAEKQYYESIVQSRLNLDAQNVALLAAEGITEQQIQSLKAMGLAETEVAERLGTTTVALQKYSKELQDLKSLNEKLADARLRLTGTATEIAIAGYNREYQAAVDALDKTSVHYAENVAKLAALRDLRTQGELSSWSQLAAQSQEALIKVAEAARRDYNRMLDSSLHFTREALQAQLEKTKELEFAAYHMGGAYVAAGDKASESAEKAAAKMSQLAEETRKAKKAADELNNTYTFDLDPSDPRYVPPGARRKPSNGDMFAWQYDEGKGGMPQGNTPPPSGGTMSIDSMPAGRGDTVVQHNQIIVPADSQTAMKISKELVDLAGRSRLLPARRTKRLG